MNRYETGQLKDRCGLHLSSWSCLPVGWHRLRLGLVNIPSHTVTLARFICLRFLYVYCPQGQFSTRNLSPVSHSRSATVMRRFQALRFPSGKSWQSLTLESRVLSRGFRSCTMWHKWALDEDDIIASLWMLARCRASLNMLITFECDHTVPAGEYAMSAWRLDKAECIQTPVSVGVC